MTIKWFIVLWITFGFVVGMIAGAILTEYYNYSPRYLKKIKK